MKWRVVEVDVAGPHTLDLRFKDGTRKRVDLLPLLEDRSSSRCETRPSSLRNKALQRAGTRVARSGR